MMARRNSEVATMYKIKGVLVLTSATREEKVLPQSFVSARIGASVLAVLFIDQ